MSFYELLEIAMEKTNISASELARRTGYHRSYFTKLKKGDAKDVTWERALVIIAALDMTPSDFAALGDGE